MKIALGNHLFSLFDIYIFKPPGQIDSFTLTHVNWLYNESFVRLLFIKLILKLSHFIRQNPSLRKEVILILKQLKHPHQVPAQIIFPGQRIHPRVVVDSLIIFHSSKLFRHDSTSIIPVEIPVAIFIIGEFET